LNRRIHILAISGSTRLQSANLQLIQYIQKEYLEDIEIEIYNRITELPHFNPDLDKEDPPSTVAEFRNKIDQADGVLICTPEYVFSLPGSFKNAIEWTVSTVVFSDKPTALITASASGEKGHEELQLIMRTLGTKTTDEMQLWISGVRSKMDEAGNIKDPATIKKVEELMENFIQQLKK
jgi:chromate reductase